MDFRLFGGVGLVAAAAALATAIAPGCSQPPNETRLKGQVHLTLLHTADMHSRLYPYNLELGQVDAGLGLGTSGAIVNVGGAARLSYIVGRERARSTRVLHLDGGDCFQGAPVFNYYSGEPEMRTESAIGTDAMVVANHEFDRGAVNLATQIQKWATFPVLAANYKFDDPSTPGVSALGSVVVPFTVFDLDGLRVGSIGMANLSSLTSIFSEPNSLNITPLNTIETAQQYVDLLRPLVDVIVIQSHLGIDVDELMIQGTEGIDVVLGGHNHIVLQPPKRVQDCSAYTETDGRHYILVDDPNATKDPHQKMKRYCKPRDVLLAHSGAFAKYVGRLDAIFSNEPKDLTDPAGYDPKNGFELVSHEYTLFPITEQVPNDPVVEALLEPYAQGLDSLTNLDLLVGYAPSGSDRTAPNGGDSALGNLISTAMWLRLGVQTDFSLTNTTGIRTDLVPGPVTIEQMFNIFPFDNTITTMELSGTEIQELFDFVARRSGGRGCVSQAQVAGTRVEMNCAILEKGEDGPGEATNIYIGNSLCCSDKDCGPDAKGKCRLPASGKCSTSELDTNTSPGVCTCAADADCAVACTYKSHNCNQTIVCQQGKWQKTGAPRCDDKTYGNPQQCPAAEPAEGSACTANANSCDITGGICWQSIDPFAEYELATSNYLAAGGSGFFVLERNTTQLNTQVEQRDALVDYIRAGDPCGACEDPKGTDPNTHVAEKQGAPFPCTVDSDCTYLETCDGQDTSKCTRFTQEKRPDPRKELFGGMYSCACPEATVEGNVCSTDPAKKCSAGACVLTQCRTDLAQLQQQVCEQGPNQSIVTSCENSLAPCAAGGEQCKYLACVNQALGNYTDDRVKMVGQ